MALLKRSTSLDSLPHGQTAQLHLFPICILNLPVLIGINVFRLYRKHSNAVQYMLT